MKDMFRRIRSWCRKAATSAAELYRAPHNRSHRRLVMTAVRSQPYDYTYLLELEQAKFREMLDYFSSGRILTPESYAGRVRYISLAIRLLDIMLCKVDTYEYDGDLEFTPLAEKDVNGVQLYEINPGNSKYHCLVKVNTRNIGRFVPDEADRKTYLQYPHELYALKARHLYYLIRYRHTEDWWD